MPAAEIRSRRLLYNLLLLVFVVGLYFLNFSTKTMFYRPGSIHQWRQTDCLSITKNYYEEGMHFFEPKIHFQGPKGGKAVSEFPIMNYTVAALWKVFGEHEFIYRLLEYLIFITAIFVLYNTLIRFFNSPLLAFLSVSILLTSPLLAYYGLNFLADVPGLSLAIISLCLYYFFYKTLHRRYFYASLLIGTLAVLIKASALMPLCLLIFFSLIDILRLNRTFKTAPLFESGLAPFLAMTGSVTVIIMWYKFALRYNDNNTNIIFLLTILPIWEMNVEEIIYNLKVLFNDLFPLFLNRPMLFFFFSLVIYVIAKYRKLDPFFRYAFLFTGVYFLSYLIFFFQVFSVHDYYLINLMIFPVVTFMSFVSLVSETSFVAVNGGFVKLLLGCLLLFNSFHCAAVYRLRTVEDDKMVYWFPFISSEERNLAKYLFWDYGRAIKHLEYFEPYLRAAGIKREDFVLSIPDGSFDISLYMMDQKGFTVARDHAEHDSTVMVRFMKKVKYVVLSDTSIKQERSFKMVQHNFEPFFTRGPVQVLKVKQSG
jgi:hypothetical protein